jgi:hypothetical protein
MACKCPKGWCYHRPDCIRGPSMQLAEAIVDKFAGAEPLPLACNGPQVARLALLMKRRDELADRLVDPSIADRRSISAAAKAIDEAIDRVQHEGTPLDWRLR